MPGGWIGYEQVTADQTGITAVVGLTGLTVVPTVNASRRIRVTGHATVTRTVADGQTTGRIFADGAAVGLWAVASEGAFDLAEGSVVLTPLAGAHNYTLTLERASGTGTVGIEASATEAAWILVEDLGPSA